MNRIDLSLHIPHKRPPNVDAAIKASNEGAGHGDEQWRALWRTPNRQTQIEEINTLVQSLRPCKNLLVIGIGGSALGTKALHTALAIDTTTTTLYVLDNIDPDRVTKTIHQILQNDPDSSETVIALVSKSGETAEIAALYMVAEQKLPNASFVAITGIGGSLHALATTKGWPTLQIPEGVGGRFSVLSPVGLFPAAMCGIDIQELLDGANELDACCSELQNNLAAELASSLVAALHQNQNIHVMMPYSDKLSQFALWYVQLWSESLGKIDGNGNRIGPTPQAAIGATDQHSLLQLWREGPKDKVIGFIRVEEFSSNASLGDQLYSDSHQWLSGQSLQALMHAEQQSTEQSVQEAGQSTWTISIPSLSPFYMGQLIALWQITVAIAGRLLNVNPYNQSGVELGKQLTKESFVPKVD